MAGFTLRRAREEIFIQCRCVHLVDARLLGGIRRRVPSEQRQDAESGQGRDTAAAAPFISQLLLYHVPPSVSRIQGPRDRRGKAGSPAGLALHYDTARRFPGL